MRVPEIARDVALTVSAVGRPVADNVNGAVPPESVNCAGVIVEYCWPTMLVGPVNSIP
jgi:hypothetical protein